MTEEPKDITIEECVNVAENLLRTDFNMFYDYMLSLGKIEGRVAFNYIQAELLHRELMRFPANKRQRLQARLWSRQHRVNLSEDPVRELVSSFTNDFDDFRHTLNGAFL